MLIYPFYSQKKALSFLLCCFFCAAPCYQESVFHTEKLSTLFSVPSGYASQEAPNSPMRKDIIKCEYTFNAQLPKLLRSRNLDPSAIAQVMRILKRDGVDCGGKHKICLLFNTSNRRIVSFRWKKENGAQRVYYAYSKRNKQKNSDYTFYNQNGVCATSQRPFVMPLASARITSPYGMRIHPIHGTYKHHKGVDFGAKTGTPIHAAGSGKIAYVGFLSGYGKCVRIRHSDGYVTTYAHLDRYAKNVRKGSPVAVLDCIGFVGMTGSATNPHLHYEVRRGRSLLNPVLYTERAIYLVGQEKKAFNAQMARMQKLYTL